MGLDTAPFIGATVVARSLFADLFCLFEVFLNWVAAGDMPPVFEPTQNSIEEPVSHSPV